MTNATLQLTLLRAGTALPVLATLMMAAPAVAQDATNTPGAQASSPRPGQQNETQSPAPVSQTSQPSDEEEVVVTGTLFRTTTSATISPITVVSAEALDQRGVQTVQEGIQSLAVNNGPALTNSFTANGAFAGGASAVSLRGLSTSSTLVLFDGQRAAYYPLADDGSRNFVDLNTIPDDIVERIEVLREGASSTYGADAIAGVVNIITRREFNGIRARAEAGISEDALNANQRVSLTVGTGDLDTNGINAYVSGFYVRSEAVYTRQLPGPFNDLDETEICFEGTCGINGITNALNPNGTLLGGPAAFAFPYDVYVRPALATGTGLPGTRSQLLNPNGCQYGATSGAPVAASDLAANPILPAVICQTDPTREFGQTTPNLERFGASVRLTARLGDSAEGYFMANFQQSSSDITGTPQLIRNNAPTGVNFLRFSTAASTATFAPGSSELRLPVFVCPGGVGAANGSTGCTATSPGAVLNPNNPFAAQGQLARILGRPFNLPTYSGTRSRVYRAAAGVAGTLFDNWNYRVDATAMHNDLRRTQRNYIYIANLLTAIAQGTINLVNPQQNTQQQLDFIMPENITDSSSDLYALQATLATSLFDLPGGPVQLGFGAQIRYEAVDAPSANPDINGPAQRYFTINAFGTVGDRTVYSAFGEINAPVLDMLDVNISARYDNYSSGQSAFSPRIAARFTPIPQLAFRASYSRGFRIPSFAEANALPTTGFVTSQASNFNDTFLATYTVAGNTAGAGGTQATCSAATFATTACPAYIRGSYGQTTLASPNLDPERSRSITAGLIFNPIPALSFTVDYYDIEKTGAITQPSNAPALEAYYAGQPIPAGYNVIPGTPSTTPAFANNLPLIGFVEAQLVNANTIRARGLDFAALARINFGEVRFTSSIEASLILELSTTFPNGTSERYEGTLGNYNLTAGSGTPRWRGTWQNSLDLGAVAVTGTVNYVDGYNLSAEDQGGVRGDCGLGTGYTPCDLPAHITLDVVTQFQVNDNFTFYFNVLNALNNLPPVDPATYGAFLYNPVVAGNSIFGRQFRAGVRVNF